jgi:transcriptional regulator with XRE-family HTH domain
MPRADAKEFATEFGKALARQLDKRNTSQRSLASATGTSPSYVNHLLSGRKSVSPKWADLVADVMQLEPLERQELHRAAAIDAGFKLDLTKKT